MKKLSFLFAALFVCVLAISGCKSKSGKGTSDSTKIEKTAPADSTATPADTTAAPAQ